MKSSLCSLPLILCLVLGTTIILNAQLTTTLAPIGPTTGIAVDENGNVYLSTRSIVTKMTPSGAITYSKENFFTVPSIAVDGNGAVYFTDIYGNGSRIKKITSNWDTNVFLNPIAPGPQTLSFDINGSLYFATRSQVFKINSDRTISPIAGSNKYGFADGRGVNASFKYISGIAVDKIGNVYVADSGNNRIRKITDGGVVTTLAGSGNSGYGDGNGMGASFNSPQGVAVDGNGTV